jgi:hypothetical protein
MAADGGGEGRRGGEEDDERYHRQSHGVSGGLRRRVRWGTVTKCSVPIIIVLRPRPLHRMQRER